MTKYLAVQIDPLCQESPLWKDFHAYCSSSGINVYGNSEFEEHRSPQFKLAQELAEDLAFCSRLSDGRLIELWRWKAFKNDNRGFAEIVDERIKKFDGLPLTTEELQKTRGFVKDFLYQQEKQASGPKAFEHLDRLIAFFMELLTGKRQLTKLIRGSSHLEWIKLMAPTSFMSSISIFEAEYFNTGKEWYLYRVRDQEGFQKLLASSKDHRSFYKKLFDLSICAKVLDFHATWYTNSYTLQGVKEELIENERAWNSSVKPEQVYLLPFNGKWYPRHPLIDFTA